MLGLAYTLGASTQALAGDGYIGIYADSNATEYCLNIPPFTGRILYVIGRLSGATAPGITGCEFRIEVTNPTGWVISYSPPAADLILGNPLDTQPGVADSSGVSIVFDSCLQPNANGTVYLGTLSVLNVGGSLNQLLVRRHSLPNNPTYLCPLFTLCDEPMLSLSCFSPSGEPPCSTVLLSTPQIQDGSDPVVFQASLSSETSGGFGLNASVFRKSERPILFISPPSRMDQSRKMVTTRIPIGLQNGTSTTVVHAHRQPAAGKRPTTAFATMASTIGLLLINSAGLRGLMTPQRRFGR